ncbi:MAG: VCBS repeat-containing protein, partial [Deltaproteobacteria bacterium]|nr:VCBS repeat-containing protein [Deltaproteobacteria bacterium]
VVQDFNHESDALDLVVIGRWTVGDPPESVPFFQPFTGQGDGTFKMDTFHEPVNPEKNPSAMAAAKLTGKSNYDIVMANAGTNDVTLFFAKGLGLFSAKDNEAPNFAVGAAPQKVAAAVIEDPDDTRPDIVTLLKTGVAIMYSENTIDVTFKTVDYLGLSEPPANDMALADMNGDGYTDIITISKSASRVTVYLNLAFRKYSDPFVFGTGKGPASLVVADLNHDSCMDVATADESGETVTILKNLLCSK